ncbi:MAG: cyclic nucleotide-binding domain-containing protein [bacterium]
MVLEDADKQWLVNVLSQVDFLVYHSPDEIQTILERIEKVVVQPAAVIVKQGQQKSDFFIIGYGRVSIWTQNGSERLNIANLEPGNYFGEMSLLTGSKCNADVVADGETILYRIDPETFYDIIKRNLTLADHISKVIVERKQNRQALFGIEENVDQEEQYRRVKGTLLNLVDKEEL